MATLPKKTADTSAETSMSLLYDLFGSYHPRNFAVRLWDGTTWEAEPGQPARFTLVLQHPGALRMMFLPPNELTLGEAYIYNDFDIEVNQFCCEFREPLKPILCIAPLNRDVLSLDPS